MTLHPEVQKRAQEEIDRVVGGDRLPDFDDREHLPYIEAVVKESVGKILSGVACKSIHDQQCEGACSL